MDDSELPNVNESLRKVLLECGTPSLEGVSPREESIELLKLSAPAEQGSAPAYSCAANLEA